MIRERISTVQLLMLVVLSRLSLTLIYYGTPPVLKQDVWWQSFPAALLGIGFVWLLDRLWRRFPDHTLPQIAEKALGKVAGKVFGLAYLLFWFQMFSLDLRLTGEFFVFAFLPQTPLVVIIAVIASLAVWAAKAGVEVIGRAAQVVFPFLIGSILLVVVLLGKDINLGQLWPPRILVTGPVPHLKDMVSVTARTLEFAWIGLLVPSLNQRNRIVRAVVGAQLVLGIMWTIMGIAVYGTLGQEIEAHFFPFYAAARLVSVADFLERIDAIFLAMWVLGMFLRGGMMLWSLSTSMATWLGVKDYRPLAAPLTGLAVAYAIAQVESFSELRDYLQPEVQTPFSLLFLLLLPMFVLGVAVLRRKFPAQG